MFDENDEMIVKEDMVGDDIGEAVQNGPKDELQEKLKAV